MLSLSRGAVRFQLEIRDAAQGLGVEFNAPRRLESVYNHGQLFESGAQVVEYKSRGSWVLSEEKKGSCKVNLVKYNLA